MEIFENKRTIDERYAYAVVMTKIQRHQKLKAKGGFKFEMERRVLTMTSQTLAMKAKRVLARADIFVRLVRPSPKLTPRGCSYGLEMYMGELSRAIDILEENRIPFGEIIGI